MIVFPEIFEILTFSSTKSPFLTATIESDKLCVEIVGSAVASVIVNVVPLRAIDEIVLLNVLFVSLFE